MGNTQTREARSPLSPSQRHRSLSDQGQSPYSRGDGSRSHRSSRPDLSFLGIGGSTERDATAHEHRRETKQDREARRVERERAARLKERERSIKEEHVDGGYLVTQGVYVGTEDFNKSVVRQLMIERRLAPFWRGLNEFSDSWTEHQLMAAARGMPIPPPDQIPPELQYTLPSQNHNGGTQSPEKSTQFLTVPISARSPSTNSDLSHLPGLSPPHSLPSPTSPIASGTSTSPLFRGRAKTLAALTSSGKNNSNTEMAPREIMMPHDPFVNGQPIEAYLYKDASECPICFLYYPPYLNRTRCCDQPICSECFVQIKRPDPHPPEHTEQDSNNNNTEDGANGERPAGEEESQLVSEPSACPFCVQPEFGVTYGPPPFRRGLTYASPNGVHSGLPVSPVSSNSSLASAAVANGSFASPIGRRRATSLSANDPSVITTDRIRPDWAQKLANARAHAARRSAAATALHTAAYLMNTTGAESRSIGRRGVLRRTGGSNSGTQTPNRPTGGSQALHALAFLSERRGTGEQPSTEGGPLAPPRGSSRRSRIDDLEEMMMMEAIRMSLASEEERRKREEKEFRKEAKKREKEAKKAEKAQRKNGIYSHSQTNSALFSSGTFSRVASSSSSILGEDQSTANKGKGVDRTAAASGPPEVDSADASSAQRSDVEPFHSTIQPSPTEPSRPSHLRHMSSASSTSSSFLESGAGDSLAAGVQSSESNSALEPMFNFRSLAAVIGDEEKAEAAEHVEDAMRQSSAAGPTEPKDTAPEVEPQAQLSPPGGPVPIESETASPVTTCVPKEINTHSVEISREATI